MAACRGTRRERRHRVHRESRVGVAAAASARHDVLIAGVAGLVAGALSMAAGEYVSVSSQGVPRRTRRNGRVRRRRTNTSRRGESNGLGCCGDARDGSRRKDLRNGCWLNGQSKNSLRTLSALRFCGNWPAERPAGKSR